MYKVSVNEHPEIEITGNEVNYLLNGHAVNFDIVPNSDGTYHVLYQGKSHTIHVLQKNANSLVLDINKHKAEAKIKNDLEDLLSRMGMDKVLGASINELKAPMPGMVLKILVKEGDTVKKGDGLLVLEAMKMENNIKALGDGVVSKIPIKAGDKVEKNQVMISF